jgi:polyisoprenoid-binding protein YceI
MKKITMAFLLTVASLSAYEVDSVAVKFTAFKTYAKVGVSGTFNKVATSAKAADEVEKLLLNSSLVIDTSSVNSGNEGRDIKLVSSFFQTQGVDKISASVVKVNKDSVLVKITMNAMSVEIPMAYTNVNNTIDAKGTIDLADFGMIPSLESINKACYDLHQGKTWRDVDLSFKLTYK